ncbi:Rha family transcriptional regulator [Neisseria shayeganii]|uniref:Rha family transcriptional regulator n=1 Tax=Neisseria shayeganii TaxID=607712 RepID=UPI001E4C4C5A|nr:Rha family transcriptional regulator [Neisseria shayeganii]
MAKAFGKAHKHVLAKIDEIISQVPDSFYKPNFRPLERTVKSNLGNGSYLTRAYELTKDGFMLLVMGFTGKDAMAIKIAYIEAFNAMAEKLKAMEAPAVQLPHTISAEEAERISEKVLERCGRTGETFQKVYRGLHEYLGVDSYHHIPASMFATAMRYLDSLPQAPELFRQPEAAKGIAMTEEQVYQLSTLTRYAQQMSDLYDHLYPALNRLGSAYAGKAGSWAEAPHYWICKMQQFLMQAYKQMEDPKHIEGVKNNFARMS